MAADKTTLTEWETLNERRGVIISLLRSLTTQLKSVDQPPISQSEEAEGLTAGTQQKHAALRAPRPTSRAETTKLSWRGIEKSLELFELFDIDRDGALSHTEFRGYLAAVGRPDEIEPHVLGHRRVAARARARAPAVRFSQGSAARRARAAPPGKRGRAACTTCTARRRRACWAPTASACIARRSSRTSPSSKTS